jgi:hypothetical protein
MLISDILFDSATDFPYSFISLPFLQPINRKEVFMGDVKDILTAKYQEEINYTRYHENQRATVTNVIIAIAAVTITFFEKSKEPIWQREA